MSGRDPAATGRPDSGPAGERLAAVRHALNEIQDALARMAAGTYGRCQQCGHRIGADRLRQAPAARCCGVCSPDDGTPS